MIKLDFSRGNEIAHRQLIDTFVVYLRKNKVRYFVDSWEYSKPRKEKGKWVTAGDIDLAFSFDNNLFIVEIKTNDDLNGAKERLKFHQKYLELILNRLPRKLTVGITKINYLAVIYDLYAVYKIAGSGEAESIYSLEDFLTKFPNV